MSKSEKSKPSASGIFRKVLTILTLVLVVVVVWGARKDIVEAFNYLGKTNLFFILLLIPEQLFMYYCAGQIFFSYMAAKGRAELRRRHRRKRTTTVDKANKSVKTTESSIDSNQNNDITKAANISPWMLARISFELNFVNHAIPSGGVAGLGYITWRLKAFGSSVGQTSFMYVLRYAITILANQFQTILAIIALVIIGGISNSAWWVIGLTCLICVSMIVLIGAIIVIASSKKRIDWFAKTATNVVNKLIKVITFGHKTEILQRKVVEDYLGDIHRDLTVARQNKKILIHPIAWGVVYSFLEVATYWLVGISMGHPEILPQVMIGEAIASVIGAVMLTPGGVGGYEGAMIFIMSVLGVDAGLATAVVITTRVIVLVGTIVSGYGFYQNAVSKIGKKERAEILGEDD